ncbi:MAG: MarR family transcriptional regulator [Chloroflexi bacterium]|nr:MarR family transcriptional regulator [Chloroflexota bacterium]
MTVNSESERLALRLWFLTHRTRDAIRRCEDQVFGKYGLTAEHYAVLSTMKLLGEPVRPTDLARALERSTNSVSMLIDRMVKAGLLKRVRDRSDRRVVNVTMTSKAENALKPATLAGWEFIRQILSPLSYEDRRAFVRLHELVKYEALKYLEPGVDIEEIEKNDITNKPDIMEQLAQYVSASTRQATCQGSEKGKARR